jgi:hypothetical protein
LDLPYLFFEDCRNNDQSIMNDGTSIATLPSSILVQGIAKYLSPQEISYLGGCGNRRLQSVLPRKPLRIKLCSAATRSCLDYHLYVTEYETGRLVLDPADHKPDDGDGAFGTALYTNTHYVFWHYDEKRTQYTYLRRDTPLMDKRTSTELYEHDLSFRCRRRHSVMDPPDSGHLVQLRFADEPSSVEKQKIDWERLERVPFILLIQGTRENTDNRFAQSNHRGMLKVVRRGEERYWMSATLQTGMFIAPNTDVVDGNRSSSNEFQLLRFTGKPVIPPRHESIQLSVRPCPVVHDDFGRCNFYSQRSLESGEPLHNFTTSPAVEFVLWTCQSGSAGGGTPQTFLSLMSVGQGSLAFILQMPLVLTDETAIKDIANDPLLALYHLKDIFPARMYFAIAAHRITERESQPSCFDSFKNWIAGLSKCTFALIQNSETVGGENYHDSPFEKDPCVLPIIQVCPKEMPEGDIIPNERVPTIPLDVSRSYYMGYIGE